MPEEGSLPSSSARQDRDGPATYITSLLASAPADVRGGLRRSATS